MNYLLFLILNAILFIRPEELFPAIAGSRLYLIAILVCSATCLPRLNTLFSPASLRTNPVGMCVLLFQIFVFLSMVVRSRFDEALSALPDLVKMSLYFFLLIANVDSRERFQTFVLSLISNVTAVSLIALANHHDIVKFPSIPLCDEKYMDPETGQDRMEGRLVASGMFNDPNDLCLVLGLGMLSCVYASSEKLGGNLGRIFWLLPIPLFIVALQETHSRGGMLGVLAGASGYLFARFGGARAIPLAIIGGFGALFAVGGRQSNIFSGGGTGHQRLMLWCEGLRSLFQEPISIPLGFGPGWFSGESGLLAHNSFIQAIVEYGLLGGTAFAGAFYYGGRILLLLGQSIDAPHWVVNARCYGFRLLYVDAQFRRTDLPGIRDLRGFDHAGLSLPAGLGHRRSQMVRQVYSDWFHWSPVGKVRHTNHDHHWCLIAEVVRRNDESRS
jgi:putative inorganic carbon (HCO3(-)) transporter